jgi:hypothetical protein
MLDLVRWELTEVDLSSAEHPDDVVELAIQRMDALRDAAGGRVLATRVRLIGATELHGRLSTEQSGILHQLVAHAIEEGDIYVERLQQATLGLLTAEQLAQRRDALGDLFTSVEEIRTDPERRRMFWEELLRPLSSLSADLLKDELVDPEEVLLDARRLLEGGLLSEHREGDS